MNVPVKSKTTSNKSSPVKRLKKTLKTVKNLKSEIPLLEKEIQLLYQDAVDNDQLKNLTKRQIQSLQNIFTSKLAQNGQKTFRQSLIVGCIFFLLGSLVSLVLFLL